MVPEEIAAAASEECERMLRTGDRVGRAAYDKKKLLLYAIISGSRRHIDHLLRDQPTLFNTIEDFLWFKLSAVRDCPSGPSSIVLSDGLVPYSLDDLQTYLNKFEPSYYTKSGKDPLVYPYILLLSIQLLPAVLYMSKETGDEGYNVDAAHLSIVLADHEILSEGARQKLGVMDAYAEVSTIIRQYGSMYLRLGDLHMALEYYAQAAAAVGGGQLSWTGRGNVDQQRQRNLMLKQLLTELLLRDGGIYLLLGARGAGEEGQLGCFVTDPKARQQFLIEAACQCQEAGMYDKVLYFFIMLLFHFRGKLGKKESINLFSPNYNMTWLIILYTLNRFLRCLNSEAPHSDFRPHSFFFIFFFSLLFYYSHFSSSFVDDLVFIQPMLCLC